MGIIQIKLITVADPAERTFRHDPSRCGDLASELMIDRRKDHDRVARIAPDINAKRDRVAKSLRRQNPVGFDPPAMAVPHPPRNRVIVVTIVREVAEDTVLGGLAHDIAHARGRAIVQIRRPHAETILGRDPKERFHSIPLG